MKNIILITLFFASTSGLIKLNAQPKCEIDTLYYIYPYNIGGRKVIQLNDNNFFIVGTTWTYVAPKTFYSTLFIKIDVCGNILWTLKDTVSLEYIADTKLIEEQDASITLLIDGNRLIKLNRYGIKKWEKKLGDSINYVSTNSFIKLSNNRYLFAGKKARACILMTDTLGNAILQKNLFIDSNSNSNLQKVYKKSLNEINLLGFEDNSLLILTIDTMGNIQTSSKTALFNGSSAYKQVCFNYDSTEIFYSSLVLSTYKIYLARYTLNGVKIKDTMTNYDGPKHTNISYLSVAPNNTIELLTLGNTILLDSNFNTIWKDTLLQDNGLAKKYHNYYDFIFTKENSVITVGEYVTGSIQWNSGLEVKKSFTYQYVKTLTINGQNYINTNAGQTQLTAIITPADALNQQINWSVNDMSKAIISQTGLLTAKANGTVNVTATSADNSLATAFMNITITNQSNGLNEMFSNSVVSVYPNPANESINISFQSTITKPAFELFDAKGMLVKDTHFDKINEQLFNMNINDLADGMYLISVQVNESKIYRKVMVAK